MADSAHDSAVFDETELLTFAADDLAAWPEGYPSWLRLDDLPALHARDDQRALPSVVTKGAIAKAVALWSPAYAGEGDVCREDLEALFARVDESSAQYFALSLLTQWEDGERFGDCLWVFRLVVFCGSFAAIEALEGYLRARRDQDRQDVLRDVFEAAIAVLVEYGSPESLAALKTIASEHTSHVIRMLAINAISTYLADHMLSLDDFIERNTPDFGLDERGRLWFDFGARRIALALRQRGDWIFEEVGGTTYTSFPRKRDDPERYAAERARFDQLRGPLFSSAQEHVAWLERVMIVGRTWRAPDWLERVMLHPLLGRPARGLLWVVCSHDGRVEIARPDESGALMNIDLETIDIRAESSDGEVASLRLLHPLELDADAIERWSMHLGEFEIVQPFEQIARDVFFKENIARDLASISEELDTKVLIDACSRGWEPHFVLNRLVRIDHTPPGDDYAVAIGFANSTIGGDRWRMRASSEPCTLGRVLSMEHGAVLDYDMRLDQERFTTLSERAWSEVVRLLRRASVAH